VSRLPTLTRNDRQVAEDNVDWIGLDWIGLDWIGVIFHSMPPRDVAVDCRRLYDTIRDQPM
jgi:hypothetical protein